MNLVARAPITGFVLALGLGLASSAVAVPCVEVGDAGGLPGSAQDCTHVVGITSITGAFPGGMTNPDMYLIYINNPGLFSATTVGQPGTAADTQLFLFHPSGIGIAANDDAGGGFRSTLPAGNPLYSGLTPGLYYLAITLFNADPESVGGAIFPNAPFTSVFGNTGVGGGSPITGYSGNSNNTGTYQIALTGVSAVPEPGSMTLLGLGLAGLTARQLRRRRQREAPLSRR